MIADEGTQPTVNTDCIFCKLASRAIPSKAVWEDDDIFAFDDMNPQANVHVLFIPKRHISSLALLDESDVELIGKLMLAAAQVAKNRGIAESGYRVLTNVGRDGGQSVDHLHLHLLGGRPMGWPPG
jgi:histidine triad (HIT) family protein